jgi:hypothetical protein
MGAANMNVTQPLTEAAAGKHRLDVVKEILTTLETATVAGQQYLMGKVLTVLRHQAPRRDHWMNEAQWVQIAAELDALTREAARMAPDAAAFSRQAARLAETLARGSLRPPIAPAA